MRTTLRPVLKALGERPTPGQILDLKVCDPAMGSGAFLVESCRQLAECLVTAWDMHGATPEMPPDEEHLLHARRLVAQQCLYGVDKNPFAVSLAKLSLWLVTLVRDHAFTFIDHALKHGDSLVGLTRKQIAAFHWTTQASAQIDWIAEQTRQDIEEALGWRNTLQGVGEGSYICSLSLLPPQGVGECIGRHEVAIAIASVRRKTRKSLILRGVPPISSGEECPGVVFLRGISQGSTHFGTIFATLTP